MNAKIFFGSIEVEREKLSERNSPYDGKVVSTAPICDANDALKALEIAKDAGLEARKSTLSQRCNWLLDVCAKLQKIRKIWLRL